MQEETKPKTTAKQREFVIRVKYHYTSAGRRPKLRSDISGAVLRAVTRRLERVGYIVVDAVDIIEES